MKTRALVRSARVIRAHRLVLRRPPALPTLVTRGASAVTPRPKAMESLPRHQPAMVGRRATLPLWAILIDTHGGRALPR